MVAVRDGDLEAARKAFTGALQIDPNHGNARYQLIELRNNGDRIAARARQVKLEQVKLPIVQFDDVTLDEAVAAIDLLVRKETKEEFIPNFVIRDPDGRISERKVELQLRNVQASVALKYVLDLVGASVRYEQHAILILPGATTTPSAN